MISQFPIILLLQLTLLFLTMSLSFSCLWRNKLGRKTCVVWRDYNSCCKYSVVFFAFNFLLFLCVSECFTFLFLCCGLTKLKTILFKKAFSFQYTYYHLKLDRVFLLRFCLKMSYFSFKIVGHIQFEIMYPIIVFFVIKIH